MHSAIVFLALSGFNINVKRLSNDISVILIDERLLATFLRAEIPTLLNLVKLTILLVNDLLGAQSFCVGSYSPRIQVHLCHETPKTVSP